MFKFVRLKNVYLNISNRSILSNISLSLIKNHILTLIGPNGAGKSTLVRVILGLIKPSFGSIICIPNISFGYVPQKLNFNSFLPMTVDRFMRLTTDSNNIKIKTILKRVKAESLNHCQLNRLSGGELQRVLLAKALLKKPNVLILDEPTQGVDFQGQISLYKLIDQIRYEFECSILMVSHDLNLVMAKTNQVLCLNNHICCFGSPESIINNSEFISIFGENNIQNLALYHHEHNHVHNF